jgi:protein-L-isoaspartate(D-aspartate) O-methyltransferase
MLDVNLEVARHQMVDQQVRGRGVLDPEVDRVMRALPRHRYVTEAYRHVAYADSPLPIGQGEVMLQPSVHGLMLQAIEVRAGESVLEVGTGSGYLTACLAALGGRVRSVDIHEEFIREAQKRLAEDGFDDIELVCEDSHTLASDGPPWDVIVVTGSLPVRDASFERALAIGGRLIWIIGEAPAMRVELVTRLEDEEWRRAGQFEVSVPALRGAPPARRFEF